MNRQQRRHPPKTTARYDKAIRAAHQSALEPRDCEAEVRKMAAEEFHPEGQWSRVIRALTMMRDEVDPDTALFIIPRNGKHRMRFVTTKVITKEVQQRISQACGIRTGD